MDIPLSADRTFQIAGLASIEGGGGGVVEWGSGLEVRYRVSDDTVTIADPSGSEFVFETLVRDQGEVFTENTTYSIYEGSGGERLQYFRVYPARFNNVELSYTRVGIYNNHAASLGEVTNARFLFGFPSNPMPTSGTAVYDTSVDGTVLIQTDPDIFIAGSLRDESSADFSVNFATGQISTALHLITDRNSQGVSTDFGTYVGNGSVTSGDAGFAGTFPSVDGIFAGAFFGPAALEMAYQFAFRSGDDYFDGYVAGVKK